MNLRRFVRPCAGLWLALASALVPSVADEAAPTELDPASWSALHDMTMSLDDGILQIQSTGVDPHMEADVSGPAGWQHVVVTARFGGRTDMQLFYATTADNGYSEGRSVKVNTNGRANAWRKVEFWFRSTQPLTKLRLDPHNSPAKLAIRSVTLSHEAPPMPQATAVEDIRVADGFEVELLYSVPSEVYGSWVSMTPGPDGILFVSDQYGRLYQVTPPKHGTADEIGIEPVPVDLGFAQGLLYAFDGLYVMVNGQQADRQGLWKVTDSNNDGTLDQAEHLRRLQGGGEHGPHAVILSPDGKSLLVCAGNHTNPTDFSSSRVPLNFDEDQLLPRMWDAGGHAVGKMAPGGWVAKVSPDGQQWELVASGFRNEYDIALNGEGELFTYDADMEWDVGTPWYRPTRVNHVVSGAEFGWRSGTGKWPEYYPDSLGSVVDIGPGSPTGIVFGTGGAFPLKYQEALFIADWSYGVIYAVHMTAEGGSYTGTAERFISAAPLPVTDLVVNPDDGCLYFTIGGRRTQSGLYRVRYTGDQPTEAVASVSVTISPDPSQAPEDLLKIRRRLEALHVPGADNAINAAWPYLGHPDRHIRFAARIAVEHQPVAEWADRALQEASNTDARLTALLALVRNGSAFHLAGVLDSLSQLVGEDVSESQYQAALRVLSLVFIRLGDPDAETRAEIAGVLNETYPADSAPVNRELARLLVYLNSEEALPKTVELLETAPTQEDQLHYALCLRAQTEGWTTDLRRRYFRWFVEAAALRGGNSFSGFIKNIREEALEKLTAAEKEEIADVLSMKPESSEPVIEASSRPFVKEWTVAELLPDVEAGLSGRNYETGRQMFRATGCYKCHRFDGRGGIVGPELTAVGRRFNPRSLLESLIEPSKVISDQYEATAFVLESGKQVVGRVVNLSGDQLRVCENMLEPGRLTSVRRGDIEEQFRSKTSMMPAGLLNHLSKDEILDLVAYLYSGGNPEAPQFAVVEIPAPTFTPDGHTTDSIDLVRAAVGAGKAVLVDVREKREWDAGHLSSATLVPLSSLEEDRSSVLRQLPKGKPVYIHCRSGRRVLRYAELLKDSGVDIRPLPIGFSDLTKNGFEAAGN